MNNLFEQRVDRFANQLSYRLFRTFEANPGKNATNRDTYHKKLNNAARLRLTNQFMQVV